MSYLSDQENIKTARKYFLLAIISLLKGLLMGKFLESLGAEEKRQVGASATSSNFVMRELPVCISISTLTTREKMIHDSGGVKTVTGEVADTVFKTAPR